MLTWKTPLKLIPTVMRMVPTNCKHYTQPDWRSCADNPRHCSAPEEVTLAATAEHAEDHADGDEDHAHTTTSSGETTTETQAAGSKSQSTQTECRCQLTQA